MLKDLVMKSRSFRSFDESRPVTREELENLIDLARYCPSTVNLQLLRFTPVYEKETVARMQKLTAWAGLIKEVKLPPDGHCPTAFVIISFDAGSGKNEQSFLRDVGITAQTILLGAVEMGLGGCMIGSFDKEKTKELLRLPETLLPELCLALGKPDESPVLVPAVNGDVTYYRKDNVQYVPKRSLEEILVEPK